MLQNYGVRFGHQNYMDRFRHQKTGLGSGLGIKSKWFVLGTRKVPGMSMTTSFPPVIFTTSTRCHCLSKNVNIVLELYINLFISLFQVFHAL